MVVGSEAGPCPNLFDAERVTLMSVDGGQIEEVTSIERSHMTSTPWQAGMFMLKLEYTLYLVTELGTPPTMLKNGCKKNTHYNA